MIEARFYDTYYFCNLIKNILHNPFEFLVNLDAFYGDSAILNMCKSFQKHSTFHAFIEFIIDNVYQEDSEKIEIHKRQRIIESFNTIPIAMKDLQVDKLPIELAFDTHQIKYMAFNEFLDVSEKTFLTCNQEDVYEYMCELRFHQAYDDLILQTTKEVFHVLFQNRNLLLLFNDMMARALENTSEVNSQNILFNKSGKLKRVQIPKWVKRAVFFRDQGRCVICNKDLSGTLNIDNIENFDHIVPLAKYGMNDISNIQLLCKQCNQNDKRAGSPMTSIKYGSWYFY